MARSKDSPGVFWLVGTELGELRNSQGGWIPRGVKLGEGDPAPALESVTLGGSLEG